MVCNSHDDPEKESKYFKQRDTGGEDMAYWANIANGEACEKIIDLIKSMEENRG